MRVVVLEHEPLESLRGAAPARLVGAARKLRADVALLQETVPPEPHADQAVYRPIGGRRQWGSAVVGLTVDVTKVEEAKGRASSGPSSILGSHPGTVAVASAEVDGNPMTFVSIYGLIENGYADTTLSLFGCAVG